MDEPGDDFISRRAGATTAPLHCWRGWARRVPMVMLVMLVMLVLAGDAGG